MSYDIIPVGRFVARIAPNKKGLPVFGKPF